LGQFEPLPGEQLPGPVLLLPDLERTDLDSVGLAVGLGFGFEKVTRYRRMPTTATVSSGKEIDLTITFRVMTPSLNLAFDSTLPSE
jgi:hypothetical protein